MATNRSIWNGAKFVGLEIKTAYNHTLEAFVRRPFQFQFWSTNVIPGFIYLFQAGLNICEKMFVPDLMNLYAFPF